MNLKKWLDDQVKYNLRAQQDYRGSADDSLIRKSAKFVATILMLPFRLLFVPFANFFHDTGIPLRGEVESMSAPRRFGYRIKQLIWLPCRTLLQLPTRLVRRNGKWNIVGTVSAASILAVIFFSGFVVVQVFARGKHIENRYLQGAQRALANEDFQLARVYFGRIMAGTELTPPQEFTWANILTKTGDSQRANEVIEKLAPDDGAGFGRAHAVRALSLAQKVGKSNDPKLLSKLKWHLQNSKTVSGNFETPDLQQAWAVFHLANEDYQKAIDALAKAAATQPEFYLTIAKIYQGKGDSEGLNNTLATAEMVYRERLNRNTLDNNSRIVLANVLAQRKNFAEAEQILTKGLRIQPDKLLKRATSDFYVLMHDRARRNSEDVVSQIDFLIRAVQLDPNFQPTYQRLISLYVDKQESINDTAVIRKTFVNLMAGDQPTPMAHLVYGNFLWEEGEQEKAQFHIEQAYKMDEDYVIVLNNLAWIISQSKEPDLERAAKLAEAAIAGRHNDGRFHHTYGTILHMQKKYKEAALEFELALPSASNRGPIHQILAVIYQKLGMIDLAEKHAERARKHQK